MYVEYINAIFFFNIKYKIKDQMLIKCIYTLAFKSILIHILNLIYCFWSGEKTGSKASTIRNVTWGKSSYFPGSKDLESDMIKCDELSKGKSDDDQFMCYQNQAYKDDESFKPIQEETDDQTRSEDGSESDVSKCNEVSEEKMLGDDQFTCYQNEVYEKSESDMTKAEEKPWEEKPGDQPQSIDVLL